MKLKNYNNHGIDCKRQIRTCSEIVSFLTKLRIRVFSVHSKNSKSR